jgi:hypothetical protein
MFDKLPLLLNDKDLTKHLFVEPYPHLVIENALSKEQIDFIRSQKENLKVWKNDFYGSYRTDYLIPEADYTSMFNRLCEVFNLQQFKKDVVPYGKNSATQQTVSVNAVLSIYHQDKIANQVSTHTPLGPHRDREQKMLICLLYLGEEGDNLGGDLLLYKAEPSDLKHRDKDIELAKTVPYAPGTLVVFPNGNTSVHAVGERQAGPFDRAMVCITFECFSPDWISRVVSIKKSKEYKKKFL